jgi:hypothetical protein
VTLTSHSPGPVSMPVDRLVARNGHALDTKVGFELGWDMAAYGLRPPVLPNDALLSGYEEACARRTNRPLVHDRFVRKWLQLRANAWLRHRVVDEAVTPEFLREIDARTCPVVGCVLTHGTGADTDWSIDRLNNDGCYAQGNLVVISVRANQAKGCKTYEAVRALACMTEPAEGLTPAQWAKLLALMVVPCHIQHGHVPLVPYPLQPPKHVPLAIEQALQWILVNQCYGGTGTLMGRLKAACGTPAKQRSFHQLVQKIRRKSEKLRDWTEVWLNMSVWVPYTEFVNGLSDDEFQRVKRLLMPDKLAWHDDESIPWQLDSRGYIPGCQPLEILPVEQLDECSLHEAAYHDVARALDAHAETP